MRHSFKQKWFLTLAVIILPIGLIFGYLALTRQTGLIQANWKVTTALATLQRNPNNLAATVAAGEGFYGLKKYQRAAEYYLTASRLDPSIAYTWNALGNTYRELSLYDDAERAFRQAITLQSDQPTYYLNLADLYRRLPELQGSRDKQIEATLEAGLKATNNDTDLLKTAIDFYRQLGNVKKVDQYQKLLDSQTK